MKIEIILFLERLLNREIARRTPARGADLFANIDQVFGKENFRTIFDVGANIGQSTMTYRNQFPHAEIYSFEPVSATFKQLQTKVGTLSGVHAFQLGIGSQSSSIPISVGDDSQLSSILRTVGPETESIELMSLTEFTMQQGIKEIDFLKVDTEGYELEVLKGADELLSSQRIAMIYIEAELMRTARHFWSIDELNEALTAFGYEIFGVFEQQPRWNGDHSILFCNVLYIAPKLVPNAIEASSNPLRTRNEYPPKR